MFCSVQFGVIFLQFQRRPCLGILLELDNGEVSVKGYEDEGEDRGCGRHVVAAEPHDTHRSGQVP